MGRVFKAFDLEVKEKVALKLLRPEIASNPGVLERFRNEIKLGRLILRCLAKERNARAKLMGRIAQLKYGLLDIDHKAGDIDAGEALLDELWKKAGAEGKNPRADVNLIWTKADFLTTKKSFKEAEEACAAVLSYYETYENKEMLRIPYLL
ncbi:MAG: hypothetical protein FJY80_04070 [Candidatus Aminicenantes bacterium]|nr:hypothetical protein [Candidatus Aminicenantes bacterium]